MDEKAAIYVTERRFYGCALGTRDKFPLVGDELGINEGFALDSTEGFRLGNELRNKEGDILGPKDGLGTTIPSVQV